MKPSIALKSHHIQIRKIVEQHHGKNVRVFGSVLRHQDREDSDLDLIIDPTPQTTLMDIGAIRYKLKKLLGVPVNIVTPSALPDSFRDIVLSEALPI